MRRSIFAKSLSLGLRTLIQGNQYSFCCVVCCCDNKLATCLATAHADTQTVLGKSELVKISSRWRIVASYASAQGLLVSTGLG
jgi:hypothetical protein